MAAGVVEYKLSINTKNGQLAFNELSDTLDDLEDRGEQAPKKIGNAFDNLGAKIVSVNQLTELAKKAFHYLSTPLEKIVNVGAKFEDMQLQLETVLGSAEKAKEYFEWIKDFSSRTPFQIEGLTQSVTLLESFGINGQKYLRTFGDTAAGLKIPLQDLSRVMGQIWQKPKAQTEEMLQLIERGVPVARILQEQLGLTAAQVGDIGRYGIEGKKVFEALARGMEAYYGGAMEKMSRNWTGLISTLKDKWELFLARVAESKFMDKLKEKIQGVLDKIDQWAEDGTLDRIAEQIGTFLSDAIEKIGEIIGFLWRMRDTIISVAKTMATLWAIKKMKIFGSALLGVGKNLLTFGKNLMTTGSRIAGATSVMGKLKAGLSGLTGAIGVGVVAGQALAAVFDLISEAQDRAMTKIKEAADVERVAWEDLRFLQQNASKEVVEQYQQMKKAAHERGVEAGQVAIFLQQHFKNEITAIKNVQKADEERAKREAALAAAREAQKQREIAAAQQLQAEIEKLAAKYNIFLGEKLRDLQHQEFLMIQIWKQQKTTISENRESLQKYLSDLEKLQSQLNSTNPELTGIIQELKQKREELNTIRVYYQHLNVEMQEYNALLKAGIPILGQFVGTIWDSREGLVAQNAEVADFIKQMILVNNGVMPLFNQQFLTFWSNVKGNIGDVKKWSDNWGTTIEKIQLAATIMSGFRDILSALGVEINATTQGLLNMAEGAANIAMGIASKDPGAIINGVVKALGALINLFKGDGIQEAIDRENGWMQMNERLQESLHKLSEEVGNTHAATSMMLDQIIDQSDITERNFESWALRVKEIFLDMDRGYLNHKQFLTEMGEAWNALLEEAQRLHTEGSFEMLSIIREMKLRGEEIPEIVQYISESLNTGVEAFANYLKGIDSQAGYTKAAQYLQGFIRAFQQEGRSMIEIVSLLGPQIDEMMTLGSEQGYESGMLSKIFGMREFITDNEALIQSIDASRQMLEAFGNSGYLTAELFATAQADALEYYRKLQKAGATEKESLEMLAPFLAKQLWYSEQYNLSLDDQTKALIEKAKQQGIDLEKMVPLEERMFDIQNKQLEVLLRIEEMFGNRLPGAMRNTVDAFGEVNRQAARFSNIKFSVPLDEGVITNYDFSNVPKFASGGQFWTNGPALYIAGDNPGGRERITIETESQIKERERVVEGPTIINHIYIPRGTAAPDKYVIVSAVKEALDDNYMGLASKTATKVREYDA